VGFSLVTTMYTEVFASDAAYLLQELHKAVKLQLGEGHRLAAELLQWAQQRHALLEAERGRRLTQIKREVLEAQRLAEAEAKARCVWGPGRCVWEREREREVGR
jgi:polyhydroxyalkanoate synthesis regulator phasin